MQTTMPKLVILICFFHCLGLDRPLLPRFFPKHRVPFGREIVQSRDEPPRGDELNRTFVRSFSRSRLRRLDHKLVCTPEENTFRILPEIQPERTPPGSACPTKLTRLPERSNPIPFVVRLALPGRD